MVPSLRGWTCLVVIGASLCVASGASADEGSLLAARQLFQRGVKAVAENDLAGALAHFEHAYAQSPKQTVLFNIAETQVALGQFARAARSLRQYAELDRPSANAARARRVRELRAYTERQLGKVAVDVTPADSVLEVDGFAETPDAQGLLEVAVGSRQFVLTRAGYQPAIQRVEVAYGQTTPLRIELSPSPTSAALDGSSNRQKGVLRISTSPAALVLVDGNPLLDPAVDPGTYVVEVNRKGYQPWRRNVQVAPAQTAAVTAVLVPAPPPPEAQAVRSRRSWAIGSGVAGALFATGGIALLATNHGRYLDYRRSHDAFSKELASGRSSPDFPERAASLESRAASIQRTDDVGIGMTVLGGLLLAVSGTLLVWDLGG